MSRAWWMSARGSAASTTRSAASPGAIVPRAASIPIARAPFRVAYHVTFLARERVRVAATDFSRIREYTEDANRTLAPSIEDGACSRGTPLANGQYLCADLRAAGPR